MRKNLSEIKDFLLSDRRGQAFLIILTLAVSLLIRLLLFRYNGYFIDENSFKAWYNTAAEKGLYGFYDSTWSDYPPFNIYIFWLFGKISHAIGPGSLDFMIKLPQNLFDLATAYLIFRFLRPRYSFIFSLGAMLVYALNPAVIFDLAVWGQFDSIYTFFLVASLYALLRSRYELSGGLFSVAILTKPQSVVLLPVLAYVMLRNGGWKRAITSGIVFFVVLFVLIIPFHWDNPIKFLVDRYSGYNVYPYNSINAYNIWALLGFWKSDIVPHLGLTYQQWGILAFVLFTIFVMWQLHRKPGGRAPVYAVFLLMFGFFMLMTRMHERYLFPVFALLAMYFSPRIAPWLYAALIGTFFANLAYVLSVLNASQFIPDGHWSIYVLSPLNILLFAYAIWSFVRTQGQPETEKAEEAPHKIPPPPEKPEVIEEKLPPVVAAVSTPRSHALILTVLVLTFFGVSVWNLGDMRAPGSDWTPQTDPDEVYLDLGSTTRVDRVFLLVQNADRLDVDLYWGYPGNWTYQSNMTKSGVWREWGDMYLGRDTRYVRLLFKGLSGRIGEVALYNGGQRLNISSVVGQHGGAGYNALIDEQTLFTHPASNKSRTILDEIYFVRAAEEILDHQEQSELTHPPMSKLIIAASIGALGHNPFGWRFADLIFATAGILLVYLFAKRMFKSSRAGLIAAFLLAFEFMHFVQGRYSSGESFILFFVIAMFYCFYRYYENPDREGKWLFLSLVFFGFGFATKWVVMWGFVGLVFLLFLLKLRKPTISMNEVLWFIGGGIAAIAIYMLSWIPYFLVGHGLGDWWHHQIFMFNFHAGLTATHPSTSDWWSWPWMLRPFYYYYGKLDGSEGILSSFGNPALWWASVPLIVLTAWLMLRKFLPPLYRKLAQRFSKSKADSNQQDDGEGLLARIDMTAAFIVIPFLTQWLCFIFIGRVLFIYHFFPNVLFTILAAVLWAEWLWKKYSWGKWFVAAYIVINVACFAIFFPVISGYPMSSHYWDIFRWMRDWVT
ncbi:MAG: phospholipid carrier-dependent glycosyltransferase [Chloroflexi bacterium]|nr:phospholipid carrier-dependent glycosyltransferase [Chloroflexota bacterium]